MPWFKASTRNTTLPCYSRHARKQHYKTRVFLRFSFIIDTAHKREEYTC